MAEIWLLRVRIMRIVFFAVSGIMQKMHNAPVGIVPLPLLCVCAFDMSGNAMRSMK
jgi:hypothetical protein